jgi:hypothetical protein
MQPEVCDDAAGGPADIVTTCAYHSGFDRGTHALTARGIDTFKPEAIPSEESPDC